MTNSLFPDVPSPIAGEENNYLSILFFDKVKISK
jgi:hypothetical protein